MRAIDIMWLNKYLDTPDKRPTWCWVANSLIKGDAYLHSTPRVESARLNWALQTWRTRQGKHSKLPDCIKRMLKAAKKYNARVQSRNTDTHLKGNMIIWHHTYGAKNNYNMNKLASKCLKNNHKIKTVREMNDYVKKCRQGTIEKCRKHNCLNMAEKLLRTLGDRWNPIRCTPYKVNLNHTPTRKEANNKIGNGPILYNQM